MIERERRRVQGLAAELARDGGDTRVRGLVGVDGIVPLLVGAYGMYIGVMISAEAPTFAKCILGFVLYAWLDIHSTDHASGSLRRRSSGGTYDAHVVPKEGEGFRHGRDERLRLRELQSQLLREEPLQLSPPRRF